MGRTVLESPKANETKYAQLDRAIDSLQAAREEFLARDGVIGVGYGFKEKGGRILEDVPAIVVYVREKKDKRHLDPDELIPSQFGNVPTDVVVPGHRMSPAHNRLDGMWLDQVKIHLTNPQREVFLEPRADQDLDHVAILEIDDTYVNGSTIDFVKAVQRFLTNHPDVFDFITFYVDTSTGLPNQGSYHSGVYNQTTGINYYAGSNLDIRSTYGSQKLQAILSLGWIGNAVLLQELGHMWGAYVRNRDTQAGANQYDLLISPNGQGLFHWGRFFDNDHSPMDYDGIDWEALSGNQFQSHSIADDFYHFCPLDLYLMGLIAPSQIGSFYVIKGPSGQSGTITGTRKNLGVQNVIWAEGARNPAYPSTQKVWRQAFVVLTKNAAASQAFANQVAQQRREFTWEFYETTRFLGRVDTTLAATTAFPAVNTISVAADNDRAIVGWRTSNQTKGRVNYATTPAAFERDRAHTTPFSTVAEAAFGTSHGVLLTGLTPNTTYYFEVIAETPQGLVDRVGLREIYTRKTNDACAPDINNVSVQVLGTNVFIKWKTDEPSDSRVTYGIATPPALNRVDPYPTTNHSVVLSGLPAGTYHIRVGSRDAAGNLTTDNNGGNYYNAVVPAAASPTLAVARSTAVAREIIEINSAAAAGNVAGALDRTRRLISNVIEPELRNIAQVGGWLQDEPGSAFQALAVLAGRMGSLLEVFGEGADYIDFSAVNNPLYSLTCVGLPADRVATECGHPALFEAVSKVYPGIVLEPHPGLRADEYRLREA